MEIFCDHKADICMWDSVLTMRWGMFNPEFLSWMRIWLWDVPSSWLCDNIWSVVALEAISIITRQRVLPLQVNTGSRSSLTSNHWFFSLQFWENINRPAASAYQDQPLVFMFFTESDTGQKWGMYYICFCKDRHCICLYGFIFSYRFCELCELSSLVFEGSLTEDLISCNYALGQCLLKK